MAFSLKAALDVIIDEYKEQYKDEGRRYAKELGDKLVERVREDPEIRDSITALQALCWSVIAYLSLVTLIVFFSLIAITRGNRRLRKKFDELQRKFDTVLEVLNKK
jgi:CHASE3 domain sensor protein